MQTRESRVFLPYLLGSAQNMSRQMCLGSRTFSFPQMPWVSEVSLSLNFLSIFPEHLDLWKGRSKFQKKRKVTKPTAYQMCWSLAHEVPSSERHNDLIDIKMQHDYQLLVAMFSEITVPTFVAFQKNTCIDFPLNFSLLFYSHSSF